MPCARRVWLSGIRPRGLPQFPVKDLLVEFRGRFALKKFDSLPHEVQSSIRRRIKQQTLLVGI